MHVPFSVLAAVLSSALRGMAAGATRFMIDATDQRTLGTFQFGLGF
jgi:hypothetical protein